MTYRLKLKTIQWEELGKTCLDAGKITFLGTVAAYFLPTLSDKAVTANILFSGLIMSLILIVFGVILLGKGENE